MAKKDIAKSVRMTSEVYKFVEGFRGEGFNEKFENLVLFCLREEKEIQNSVKKQQKTYEANEKRIELQRKVLSDLESIGSSVSSLLSMSKVAEVRTKGVQLKMQAAEAAENVTQKPRPRSSSSVKVESQKKATV